MKTSPPSGEISEWERVLRIARRPPGFAFTPPGARAREASDSPETALWPLEPWEPAAARAGRGSGRPRKGRQEKAGGPPSARNAGFERTLFLGVRVTRCQLRSGGARKPPAEPAAGAPGGARGARPGDASCERGIPGQRRGAALGPRSHPLGANRLLQSKFSAGLAEGVRCG